MSSNRIYLYDSTLRDGGQTQGVDFSAADKRAISVELDKLGLDYIEGGWPGANPTDDAFFRDPPKFTHAKLTAFGRTRKSGRSASNDPGFAALVGSKTAALCLVGKSWDFQVDVALGIGRDENLAMIRDSISHAAKTVPEVLFDAEHFFDGYKDNPEYALACIMAAYESGARWIVLCDTNGGTLPDEIEKIVAEVVKKIPGEKLGIHCHNDTENAVANSLAAVRAGVRQIQGTLNGLGERCGNANLISILPTLVLKMGFETGVSRDGLKHLTHVSRLLDERLNRIPQHNAPYVCESAFAHKGGLHVSAVEKNPRCYEHIPPEVVGNRRHVVVSDQAGRSNIMARFREMGFAIDADNPKVQSLVDLVKTREFEGYAYDGAEASFELLVRRVLEGLPEFFRLNSFRILDERRWNAKGELITLSEATTRLQVEGEEIMTVADGNGPVNALDAALRKGLIRFYPSLENLKLLDYKVRILTPGEGTRAVTRVMIESSDGSDETWSTIGVSANVIDASFIALNDSITYKLIRDRAKSKLVRAPA